MIGADTTAATQTHGQPIEMPPEAQADSPLPIFDATAEDAPETSLAAAEPLVESAENPAPPEQILPQNPLDTEPPRDTFAS